MAEHKWDRLIEARDRSWQRLSHFRDHRRLAIRQFVGVHYGIEGASKKVPLNYLELAISIYRRLLAPRIPKVLWTTQIPQLRSEALTAEYAANELLKEMEFGRVLQEWTTDALFSLGILKLGLEPTGPTDLSGQPFAETVSLDDFVYDTGSNSKADAQFLGNRYFLPIDHARNLFNSALEPSEGPHDNSSDIRSSHISTGQEAQDPSESRWLDTIELWDMWLPWSKQLVTFQCDNPKPIRIMDWKGPDNGPFYFLAYEDVPDNFMPLPPVANLIDLHMLANLLFRKLANQATNAKNVIAYAEGHEADARRLQESSDLDLIRMDDPNSITPFKTGELDKAMAALTIQLRDMFSYQAGNLDLLGGLSAQSDTLGQDKLLNATASERLREMQDRTLIAVTKVTEDIGEYLWTDKGKTRTLLHQIGQFEVELEFGPNNRKGDLSDYLIEVAPYSLQTRSPAERLQTIQSLFQTIILPMAPQMEQQGLTPDIPLLMDLIARYSDTPEIRDIVTGIDSSSLAGGQHAREGRQSPVTTRTNVRENRPGSTQGGRDDVIAKAFLGAGLSGSEAGSLRAPVSGPPA